MFTLDPYVVDLASLYTCHKKDRITRMCVSHTCVTWLVKSLSFFSSCKSRFSHWDCFRSWFLQQNCSCPVQRWSFEIPTSGRVLWALWWCSCTAHFLLFFHLLESLILLPSGRLHLKIYTIRRTSSIANPGRLPQKQLKLTKKDTGSRMYNVWVSWSFKYCHLYSLPRSLVRFRQKLPKSKTPNSHLNT